MIGRLICPKCYTGKVSFRLAMSHQNKLVKDWHKCSNNQCDNNSFCADGERGDRSTMYQMKHYYKINSFSDIQYGI